MIAFIDDHREACGVEPICKVLPIAASKTTIAAGWATDCSLYSGKNRHLVCFVISSLQIGIQIYRLVRGLEETSSALIITDQFAAISSSPPPG